MWLLGMHACTYHVRGCFPPACSTAPHMWAQHTAHACLHALPTTGATHIDAADNPLHYVYAVLVEAIGREKC